LELSLFKEAFWATAREDVTLLHSPKVQKQWMGMNDEK